MPRNIKLTIAYDGTDFSGWQRQGCLPRNCRHAQTQPTIQGEIEAALAKIHKQPITLYGAGRTDAGVHAVGQTANFHCGIASIPVERFVPALNGLLPTAIRVRSALEAPSDFHARFDAVSRSYRYQIVCGRQCMPHESRYCFQIWHTPDMSALNGYARLLRGEMDCSIFAAAQDKSLSRFRNIHRAQFFWERDMLVFEITANAFLWNMVRSVVGTLLAFERAGLSVTEARNIIASADRSHAGPTVPPTGLFLWKVLYK